MKDDVRSVLNELIETSKDGEKGFAKAAQDARDAALKSLFSEYAERCRSSAVELQSLVLDQGGTPAKTGSSAAALRRGWMSVKEALTARKDLAILEECEKAEDYAKAEYRKALTQDLPADVRAVVERQNQGVIANHDRVRALRDRFRAGSETAGEAR
jgi:uncharacterized protein (TIGR02284 family)